MEITPHINWNKGFTQFNKSVMGLAGRIRQSVPFSKHLTGNCIYSKGLFKDKKETAATRMLELDQTLMVNDFEINAVRITGGIQRRKYDCGTVMSDGHSLNSQGISLEDVHPLRGKLDIFTPAEDYYRIRYMLGSLKDVSRLFFPVMGFGYFDKENPSREERGFYAMGKHNMAEERLITYIGEEMERSLKEDPTGERLFNMHHISDLCEKAGKRFRELHESGYFLYDGYLKSLERYGSELFFIEPHELQRLPADTGLRTMSIYVNLAESVASLMDIFRRLRSAKEKFILSKEEPLKDFYPYPSDFLLGYFGGDKDSPFAMELKKGLLEKKAAPIRRELAHLFEEFTWRRSINNKTCFKLYDMNRAFTAAIPYRNMMAYSYKSRIDLNYYAEKIPYFAKFLEEIRLIAEVL